MEKHLNEKQSLNLIGRKYFGVVTCLEIIENFLLCGK
jgi:hypothetical protein